MPSWRWENVWLVYCIWGMLVLPWVLNLSTVPHLDEIYGKADPADIGIVALFGAGWGLGTVTFGLGTWIVGNSLGFSIILGLTCTLGGTAVLLSQDAAQLRKISPFYWAGMAVALLGLALLGA